jgi:hypothetical protein
MIRTKAYVRTLVVLLLLLMFIGAALYWVVFMRPVPAGAPAAAEAVQYLAQGEHPKPGGFRFQDVPAWLFIHVAVIAVCQVLSLMFALRIAHRPTILRRDLKAVQFLCEIPMFLGLFGTLLGVCLTQFLTGSLVAPLAYLTTMSGILLYIFGRLTIWLPLPGAPEADA